MWPGLVQTGALDMTKGIISEPSKLLTGVDVLLVCAGSRLCSAGSSRRPMVQLMFACDWLVSDSEYWAEVSGQRR